MLNWGTKDTWQSVQGEEREIGWEHWWMCRQVGMTLLHMVRGFSHLNKEADNSDIIL